MIRVTDADGRPYPFFIFLVAVSLQGWVYVLAIVLGAILDVSPTARMAGAGWQHLGWGLAAGLVPALALVVALHRGLGFAHRALDQLGKTLDLLMQLAPWQLAIVALMAGLTEEALFRGVLQTGVTQILMPWVDAGVASAGGLAVGALLFGLAHPVSRSYGIAAAVFGVWLGGLLVLTGNLTTAVVAHAVYDVTVMLYVKYQRRDGCRMPAPAALATPQMGEKST